MYLANSKERHIRNLKVKLGHGGTLDPMATGVLIVGVGKGTKHLSRFLECTKSYECVVLFGAATDSYDAVGKVVSKAPYEHITRALVEEKLSQFRGKIMQKPSIFSALKVDGKKMYEYAREGKDVPEVAARPVEVHEMELVEWLEPGSHEFAWPKEEVDGTEMEGAEKLLGIRQEDLDVQAKMQAKKLKTQERKARKRSRTPEEDDNVEGAGAQPKRPKTDREPAMSGALPVQGASVEKPEESREQNDKAEAEEEIDTAKDGEQMDTAEDTQLPTETTNKNETTETSHPPTENEPSPSPPAARIRMTVTSGFYVRSLCHDLGLACSSLGLMSSLIRLRQGDYSLNKDNVLSYSDLSSPETWEPKVSKYLEEYMEKEGWEIEEVDESEGWKGKGRMERREADRERSYKGGGSGKGKWNGKGRDRYYDKKMNGGGRDGGGEGG